MGLAFRGLAYVIINSLFFFQTRVINTFINFYVGHWLTGQYTNTYCVWAYIEHRSGRLPLLSYSCILTATLTARSQLDETSSSDDGLQIVSSLSLRRLEYRQCTGVLRCISIEDR